MRARPTPPSIQPTQPTVKPPRLTLSRPMYTEGMSTLLLSIAIVTCAGLSVQSAEWARVVIPIGAIALLSAVFGAVLAKLRVPDSLAHLLSIHSGTGVSVLAVSAKAEVLGERPWDRIRPIGDLVLNWYLGHNVPIGTESILVSILMGIVVWLVGYLSTWTLFRRGWILVALLLPGFLLLVNLGYAPVADTRYLAVYGALCIPLIARFHLFVKQREWNQQRLSGSTAIGSTFLLIGTAVAAVATLVAYQSPASLSQAMFQPMIGEVSTRFLDAQERASEWLQSTAGQPSDQDGEDAGRYSSFDDAFSVGGPLELTDEPQALVMADEAPYLAAQRYDTYSGRGWSSSAEDSFDSEGPDGQTFSPEMTFQPGQRVMLSDQVTGNRVPVTIAVTPHNPAGDRLLTVASYLTADMDTSVRLSWTQLNDEPFPLREGSITALPADLQLIATLLVQADLRGGTGDGGPAATDADLQQQIEDERQQLRSLFPEVRWTASADGSVDTLFVTGQVPNYDDVEAVFAGGDVQPNTPYRVSGSASGASAGDLAEAGQDYPEWVERRYLSLPDSITPRTTELARTLTASSSNPYEQARAIEAYLRSSIVYDETVPAPPEGVDIVDYVLFERQRGYCEYYSSAMSVMLRTIGVPSRVAVGFYPGDYDDSQGGYLYRQRNAHAWVEVFFPGYGWIPFEPTSSQPVLEEGEIDTNELVTPSPVDEPLATEEVATPESVTEETEPPAAPQIAEADDEGGGGLLAPMAVGGVLGGLLVLVGWMLWVLPLRGLSPTTALYRRLTAVGRLVGVRQSSAATPREFGRSLGETIPRAREHVNRIVQVYEVDQFGPQRPDSRMLDAASDAWLKLRKSIWRWFLLRKRA